jgi:hypothetical protein
MKYDKERWPDVNLAVYSENRPKFPPEKLVPYMGQHIAFNGEGTAVVASAPEMDELFNKLDAMGIPQTAVVIGWVPEE